MLVIEHTSDVHPITSDTFCVCVCVWAEAINLSASSFWCRFIWLCIFFVFKKNSTPLKNADQKHNKDINHCIFSINIIYK